MDSLTSEWKFRLDAILIVTASFIALSLGAMVPHLSLTMVMLLSAGTGGALLLSALGRKTEPLFLVSLGCLLIGYMMQGRGFAYVGLPPFYIGEITLVVGLAAIVVGKVRWRVSGLQILLVFYMALGASRTIPFIRSEGILAIRDAVLWYYAVFALIVSLILTRDRLTAAVRAYAVLLPFLLVWFVAMSTVFRFFVDDLPRFPGSPLPIISSMIPGNRAVMLAGMAAFFIIGLHKLYGRRQLSPAFFWVIWLISAGVVAVENRGGLLAIVLSLGIMFLIRPSKEILRAAFIGLLAVAVFIAIDPSINLGGGRVLSVEQVTVNITSIFSDETGNLGSVQSTKNWRLDFWNAIYTDIIRGPDFWTGKGFGLNLATYYGFQVLADESLRSPHNSHVTVLGRMGVLGMGLWIAIHLTFAASMVAGYFRNRRSSDGMWWRLYLWFFAMWVAMTVEAIFDVYYEAPQGGIWMWCVVGAGIAALRIEREQKTAGHTQDALM
jgi:hypothetical protein